MKILVLDPDPRIRKNLEKILADEFVIDTASCARDAEELFSSSVYDLLLMDLILPDIDGEHFINLIRAEYKNLPVIVISNKSHVSDKNIAFDHGADDYIVKPINNLELRSRIKAQIRRKNRFEEKSEDLRIRDLLYDRNKRMAFYKDKRLTLRKKELMLLEFLLINRGRVVTRMEILENVWDASASPFTNTVEVHLKRLRDKIEKPFSEKYIETIHGLGYVLE